MHLPCPPLVRIAIIVVLIACSSPWGILVEPSLILETRFGHFASESDISQVRSGFLSVSAEPDLVVSVTEKLGFVAGMQVDWTGFFRTRDEFSLVANAEFNRLWPNRELSIRVEPGLTSGPAALDPNQPQESGFIGMTLEHAWKRGYPITLSYSFEAVASPAQAWDSISGSDRRDFRHRIRVRLVNRSGTIVKARLGVGLGRNGSSDEANRYFDVSLFPSLTLRPGERNTAVTMMYLAYRAFDPVEYTMPDITPPRANPEIGVIRTRSFSGSFSFVFTREITDAIDITGTYDLSLYGSSSISGVRSLHRLAAGVTLSFGSL